MIATLLVTGATGSIGRILVPALFEAGFTVRGQYARQPGSDQRVAWVQADFAKDVDFDALTEGCDGVVHLAGELVDPTRMERLNVEATAALIDAAHRNKLRYFGLASSMVVYGSPSRRIFDEGAPVVDPDRPVQPQFLEPFATQEYARTKVLAERAVSRFGASMAVDIFRIAKSADADRLLEVTHWSAAQRAMRLYGFTNYIDQRDCAAAIVHLAKRGLTRPRAAEVYNIADSDSGTYAELLADIYAKQGRSRRGPPLHVPLLLEMLKNALKYRSVSRLPASAARMLDGKLRGTGFVPPIGYHKAVEQAVAAPRSLPYA